MLKRIICVVLLLVFFILPVSATDPVAPYVVDSAELLTQGEHSALLELLSDVSGQLQMDVVVVTVPDLNGKSAMAYADDYYDYNGYAPNGVLLLVAMAEREWWISTSGSAIRALSDADLDRISQRFLSELSSGDYAAAFTAFAQGVLERAQDQGGFSVQTVLICLLIGAVIAFIVTGILKGQLKSVRRQNSANSYIRSGSLQLTNSRDIFLYRNVSRRAKPQNNGSTTHRSSSGRSHGGRGGRF